MNIRRWQRLLSRLFGSQTWRYFYLQRFVARPSFRRFGARLIARWSPRVNLSSASAESQEAAKAFQKDGVVVLGQLMPRSQVDQIVEFLANRQPSGDSIHAYFSNNDILEAPGVLDFINSPQILDVVQGVLGCKPTISLIRAWWLYSDFKESEAALNHPYYQREMEYHRDIDDWQLVRMFVYLTDVDAEAGPHSYIAGTQRISLPVFRGLDFDRHSSLQGLLAGRQDIVGPAGTVILIDPYGLHRARVPKSKDRLVLGISYGFRPLPQSPTQPVATLPAASRLDPYINRTYVSFDAPVSRSQATAGT